METKRIPVVEKFFGHELTDNYRWLENAKDPEVLEWVAKENERTDHWFDSEKLAHKVAQLKEAEPAKKYASLERCGDGYIALEKKGGFPAVVYLDKELKNEQPVLARYEIEHITPVGVSVSPCNNRYIAVQTLKDGDNKGTVLIMDWAAKTVIKIINDVWDAVWSGNVLVLSHAYYNADSKLTTLKVNSYDIASGEEKTIYEEFGVAGLGKLHNTFDKKHLLFEIWDDFSNWRYVELEIESGKSFAVNTEAAQISYIGTKDNEHYFISKELSENGTLVVIKEGSTLGQAYVIREGNEDMLETGFILDGELYILGKRNVSSILFKIVDGKETKIQLPSDIGTAAVSSRKEDEVVIKFESFSCPMSFYEFDGKSFEAIFQTEGEQYDDIVIEQKWAASKGDGRMIPYFFIHEKDAEKNRENPVMIYAYGGYNCPMTPWYQDMVTEITIGGWVRKGGIYVLANIRGGNEFGSKWHEEGMRMKKRNCYDDFIGVTEQLIQENWTNPKKIAINGCSNGGLLMSALVTMRPDLFGCVIDSVPHTDMIRFALDDNGSRYVQEYGDPMESKEAFEYMLSYSPCHNVREEEYPPTYIQTGECDNNVPPYHGKKLAALMQKKNRGENPVLLRVLPEGAHDRGSGEAHYKTIAEIQLFIEKALGM